jgi:hypothetical protein
MKSSLIWSNKPKLKFYGLLFFIIVLGLTLLLLPADFFDKGKSICISVLLLDKECYGCGMTRAIQHLIHLDFKTAFEYNKLSFVVFPLFAGMILWELNKLYKAYKKQSKPSDS